MTDRGDNDFERDDSRAEARRWVRQERIFSTITGIYLLGPTSHRSA